MKVSRQQLGEHRERLLEAASRLVAERGLDGFTIADVTRAAGLTHGAFYGHFPSKEALCAAACERALAASAGRVSARADRGETFADFARYYLSEQHFADRGRGCALAALATELAREPVETRCGFDEGLTKLVGAAMRLRGHDEGPAARSAALGAMATLVGSLILARAVASPELRDQIRAAAHHQLGGPDAAPFLGGPAGISNPDQTATDEAP